MEYIKYVQGHLRKKGKMNDKELKAAGFLYAYRLNQLSMWERDLTYVNRYYPTAFPGQEEQIAGSPKIVSMKLNRLIKLKLKKPNGGIKRVGLNDIHKSRSNYILQLLRSVKDSVHKVDRAIIKQLNQIYKHKVAEETYTDTKRVKANPKRITYIKHISLEFRWHSNHQRLIISEHADSKDVRSNLENALRQEALDLLTL